jgi:hypothetical protein
VTDLGLNLEEALAMHLQTEKFIRRKALPTGLILTDAETYYFEGQFKGRNQWECDRVELNAFTSPGLIEFVERKLRQARATNKVVPPMNVLKSHGDDTYNSAIRESLDENVARLLQLDRIATDISKRFKPQIQTVTPKRLAAVFRDQPTKSWRTAADDCILNAIDGHRQKLMDALEEELMKQVAAISRSSRQR